MCIVIVNLSLLRVVTNVFIEFHYMYDERFFRCCMLRLLQ